MNEISTLQSAFVFGGAYLMVVGLMLLFDWLSESARKDREKWLRRKNINNTL